MARKPSTKPAKKSPRQQRRRRQSRAAGKRRSGWRLIGKLALLPLVAVVLAVFFLDRRIVREFEARRWDVPATVYARPMELYPGLPLTAGTLAQYLERASFSPVPRPDSPGTYRRDGRDAVTLSTRPFDFWDGAQPALTATVRFAGGLVAGIDTDRAGDRVLLRLNPVRIGSILPGSGEDRVLVRDGDLPPLFVESLLAVEDRRFYSHHGLDLRAIGRAAFANLKAGGVRQGGSTLTQQLVKSYFLSNERSLSRKLREAVMAVLLDAHYDKQALLIAYANEVYLGQDGGRAIHGIGLASRFYFDRDLDALEPRQVAMLVGMIRGPSLYDPRRHPVRTRERRDRVLAMMAEQQVIAPDFAAAQAALPLGLTERRGGEDYYPAFMDLVRRQLRGQYRDEDLTTAGLNIFSTLDLAAQAVAQRELSEGIVKLEAAGGKDLNGAVVVTGVPGGEVLALVGDRRAGYAGFNRALDAARPVGSLLKPFVVLRALEEGRYTLLTQVDDEPLSVPQPDGSAWSPKNYDGIYRGHVPLYRALTESINIPIVRVALDIGIRDVANTVHAAGTDTMPAALPSLSLGALSMSPLDVGRLYSTLADGGFSTPLRAVVEVIDAQGQPLRRFPLETRQVFDAGVVYQVNQTLAAAVTHGTGRAALATLPEGFTVAGKTGTTDDLRDSWFAGFSDDRVTVVWVGRDDNTPAGLTGATGALPIWSRIMASVAQRPFAPPLPDGLAQVWVDYASGLVADQGCASDGAWLVVPAGFEPASAPGCTPLAVDGGRRSVGRRALDWLKKVFD